MTLEELKAEAKRQGYNLIKAKKYVPHVRCNCGGRGNIWYTASHESYVGVSCSECGIGTHKCKTERDAWLEWYEMQTGRRFEE